MGVDHGRTNILMPQQFLNGTNVISVLQEMGGKAMPEGMARNVLADGGIPCRFLHSPLKSGRVDVVTTLFSGARVEGAFGGGKEVLPGKFTCRVRVFAVQGVGKVDFAQTGCQILFVDEVDPFDLALE